MCKDGVEQACVPQRLEELSVFERSMVLLLEAEDGENLEEAHIELWAGFGQRNVLRNLFELFQVLSLHQEKLDAIEGLQEEVLVLIALQDGDEEAVASLLHAADAALLKLE